jgi:hypothetical protein
MKKRFMAGLALVILALIQTPAQTAATPGLRFEVTIARGLISSPQNGRLFVIMSRSTKPEPRLTAGTTGLDAPPIFGRDIDNFAPPVVATIDERAARFPIQDFADLPAGDYFLQALFDTNIDLKSINSPGNLYSATQKVHLDPARGSVVKLELTEKIPPEELPAETEYIKYVKLESKLLSKFHGRPIYLRAGIILPKAFDQDPSRRYPLRVSIGGYGSRFTTVQRMMSPGSGFRNMWLAVDTPRMILLHLDGDGPYGDCYQVNSDNNGPFGDAVTQELIPFVEQKYRCIGEPYARVLDGGSTGGWVSLALQVFYPDFFNGAWSGFPDGVDFRAFQLVNIYKDDNAYVNEHGFERPSARDLNGDVRFTIRHECQMENALGLGDSWTMSGEQWGAWNAAYGPRGANKRPVPLWDPKTGKIDRAVVEHWKKYDLRMVMEQNWKTLGPKLRGKIRIWVGEADQYFLNNAVHLLDDFLATADPPYEGKIIYGPGKGHGWMALSERQIMQEMAAAIERARH